MKPAHPLLDEAYSGQGIDLGLPCEDRLAPGPFGWHVTILCDLAPAPAGRGRRPIWHAVLGSGVERPCGLKIRKVGDDDDRIIDARPSRFPTNTRLPSSKTAWMKAVSFAARRA